MRRYVPALALLLATAGAMLGRRSTAERVVPNDNRESATLRGGVLALRLDVRLAAWHPDGEWVMSDTPGDLRLELRAGRVALARPLFGTLPIRVVP